MNATVEDLRSTIVPRSDQLNSEQLMFGAIDITVTRVEAKAGEQPVTIHYEGEAGRPYKPCLTMRKVLVHAWGENGNNWVGRSMRLYCDPAVRFGKDEVGGIRISHLTDIPRDIRVSLTATKGKKALHEIKRMAPPVAVDTSAIEAAADVEALKTVFGKAYTAAKGQEAVRGRLKVAYDMRMALLLAIAAIEGAESEEAARAALAEALTKVPPESRNQLQAAFDMAWTSPDADPNHTEEPA